jgi:serine phosphatase RsbU (regulator of sigma subunit)
MGARMPFDEGTGRLDPGDLIVLYSDGVTEGENPAGGFFGEDRLYRSLRAVAGAEPEAVCEKIMNDLIGFSDGVRLRDDVTVMAVRYAGCAIDLPTSGDPGAGLCH